MKKLVASLFLLGIIAAVGLFVYQWQSKPEPPPGLSSESTTTTTEEITGSTKGAEGTKEAAGSDVEMTDERDSDESDDAGASAASTDDAGKQPSNGRGTDGQGQELYLVIAASVTSQENAETRARLISSVGDVAIPWAVDRSDHYDGLRPGFWIVATGHKTKVGANTELHFLEHREDFKSAYIAKVTKNCDDPLDLQE